MRFSTALSFALWWCVRTGVEAADPRCSRGIRNDDEDVCCPRACRVCGGDGCHSRPGGYRACCASGVLKGGRRCSGSEAPCHTLIGGGGGGGGGSVRRRALAGAHCGPPMSSLFDRERAYHVEFDAVVLYMPVRYLKYSYLQKYMDANKTVQLVMEFQDSYPNLRAIGDGEYDAHLRAFAADARRDGRPFHIRPLHELDGDWYNWCVFAGGGNSPETFKRAFRHIVTLLRDEGVNAKFQLSYNVRSASGHVDVDRMTLYPGDDVVDLVCASVYNRFGIPPNRDARSKNFKELFQTWYDAVRGTGKNICIAEHNASRHVPDKSGYIRDAWRSMAVDFPKLTLVNWFFEEKSGMGFDLEGESQIEAFRQGLAEFRRLTGGVGGATASIAGDDMDGDSAVARIERARLEYEQELRERGLTTSDRAGQGP